MAIQLTFNQEIRYKDDPTGISLPTFLSYGGKTICVPAKVDPGAAVRSLQTRTWRRTRRAGRTGHPESSRLNWRLAGCFRARSHLPNGQTGDLVFESLVYFAKYPNLPRNLLGRQGWLRNLRLAVIDYDNLLYLNGYDS